MATDDTRDDTRDRYTATRLPAPKKGINIINGQNINNINTHNSLILWTMIAIILLLPKKKLPKKNNLI